jgi:hypothetical protein
VQAVVQVVRVLSIATEIILIQAPQGLEAQAADDMFGAQDPSGMSPQGMPQGMPEGGAPQGDPSQDAEQAETAALEAKNELDNVRVSLTVRELLDLVGKGTATASLLKVKQLADTHKQKMEQIKQKTEIDQQAQAQEQQAGQQGMMGGGIYPSPMDAASGMSTGGGAMGAASQ